MAKCGTEKSVPNARKMNPKKDKALFKLIAVDGKCMRGTVQENGRCPDIVGAYSVNDGLTVQI
jgi:hypothetical protein